MPRRGTEGEIATVAYQLWLDNGCPVGSDQEDWFRAEAMLKNALIAKCEDLARRPSIPAAILAPSPKCRPISDGGTLGSMGK